MQLAIANYAYYSYMHNIFNGLEMFCMLRMYHADVCTELAGIHADLHMCKYIANNEMLAIAM